MDHVDDVKSLSFELIWEPVSRQWWVWFCPNPQLFGRFPMCLSGPASEFQQFGLAVLLGYGLACSEVVNLRGGCCFSLELKIYEYIRVNVFECV